MRSFIVEARRGVISESVMGEAANVILACAITALFLVKNKGVSVDKSHVDTMLDYVKRGTDHSFNSQEAASATYDQIAMHIPMSDGVRSYVYSDQLDTNMVESLILFVNDHKKFNELVTSVTNNGLLNRIVIDVENISVDEWLCFTTL